MKPNSLHSGIRALAVWFALAVAAVPAFAAGLVLPTLPQQNSLNPRIQDTSVANFATAFLNTTLSNVPPGYSIGNITYAGWCTDSYTPIDGGVSYNNLIVSSLDPAGLLAAGVPPASWDKINYLLNQRVNYFVNLGATWADIQKALYSYIGGSIPGNPSEGETILDTGGFGTTPNPAVVAQILADVNDNGGAFTPAPGQIVAVVLEHSASLNGGSAAQRLVIEARQPSGSIGNFVWKDTNMNGIQDPGEPGINGVKVQLCDANGVFLAETTTAQDGPTAGIYYFTQLTAGTYIVKVINSPALSGLTPTTVEAGGDSSLDSNPIPSTVVLATDSSFDYTIDFGYVDIPISPSGMIGDFVWKDLNGNGIQDPLEPGINGVTVQLLNSSNVVIQTKITAGNGGYLFTGLSSGDYTVVIDNAQPSLAGCLPTTVNAPGSTPVNDSNPNPASVNLPMNNSVVLTIDFGYVPKTPSFTLTKTVNKTTINAGQAVEYTYTVKNTGAVTLTGVSIVDDNATPNYPGDDFTVASGLTLLPGQQQSYVATTIPPYNLCALVNSVNTVVGTLITEPLGNGDVKVTYRQSLNIVDNTYGTNASPGWLKGHTFANFTGSDKAQFQFYNGANALVLDATIDYLTQVTKSATFPSGYGTLGASGGDGKLNAGSLASIASVSTTMSTNLNQSPAFYGYIVNSPAPAASFPTWDYVDGFTVVVKGSAFGTSGFGKVVLAEVHNSPAKTGEGRLNPVPCDSIATNKARGTATAGSITLTAEATATVTVKGSTSGGGGNPTPVLTYPQDCSTGWGEPGKKAATLLTANFATLYPAGVTIGGTKTLKFTSANAVIAFLPASGKVAALKASAVNPTNSKDMLFAGQVLALQLNVDFSDAGITATGLSALKLKSGKLAGSTVGQVLILAEQVLGGGALPAGISISDINAAAKTINENFDSGTTNKGNLIP